MSKTSKFNISFSDYYTVYIATKFLKVLSLFSIAIFIDFFKYKFLIRNLKINNKEIVFEGDIDEFFFLELKYRIYTIITFKIYTLFKNGQIIRRYIAKTHFKNDETNFMYDIDVFDNFKNILFLVLIGILSLGTYAPFLLFKRKKYIINHIKSNNSRLFLNINDLDYIKFLLKNLLVILFTLGIYLIFFLPKNKRYFYNHIELI